MSMVMKKSLGFLIPMYIPPWTRMSDYERVAAVAASGVPVICVINPNSGPTESIDPKYAEAMVLLRKGGCDIVGYIATNYGNCEVADLKQKIDMYDEWKVDGIFWDEVDGEHSRSSYRQVGEYVTKTKGLKWNILNPGQPINMSYFDFTSISVQLENNDHKWMDYVPRTYPSIIPPEKQAVMVHTISSEGAMKAAVKQAVNRGVGWIYLTNRRINPNPWDELPNFWDSQVELVQCYNKTGKLGSSSCTII